MDEKPPHSLESSPRKRLQISKKEKLVFATILIVISAYILSSLPSILFPPADPGCGCPEVGMMALPGFDGYRIQMSDVSEIEALTPYGVAVLKNGSPFFDNTRVLSTGHIGTGPAGEYLNFTDITRDGQLSVGDYFTLENLSSG
ncbi:unnamed protein product, partial [marine sediment metagenome]